MSMILETPSTAEQGGAACPACGLHNPPDAVFCGDRACRKALGPFAYVAEEVRREARWHHRLAERFTGWIVSPHFVGGHLAWMAAWMLLNTGAFAFVQTWDAYPYFGMVTILAVETLLITVFVLISSARQSAVATERDELDYEVSVRTYRKLLELEAEVRELRRRMGR